MIVWLNGTFGAGKTSTARDLIPLIPDARFFDPEHIGYLLRFIPGLPAVDDFQDWKPWRGLVVETAVQLLDYVGGTLVMPQTVLVEDYWREIRAGIGAAGVRLHHFVLHTDEDTLVRRIAADTADPGARQWRLDHLPRYREAYEWLSREGRVVDTTAVSPAQVAKQIAEAVGSVG